MLKIAICDDEKVFRDNINKYVAAYLNEKEKDAIACYCAYTKRFKEGWITHSQNMLQEAQLLEQRWYKTM